MGRVCSVQNSILLYWSDLPPCGAGTSVVLDGLEPRSYGFSTTTAPWLYAIGGPTILWFRAVGDYGTFSWCGAIGGCGSEGLGYEAMERR